MIFAVSTVKDTVAHVEKFVRRNLAGGVDHLVVFLDDEQPEVEELLARSPHVTCVPTHRDWWHGERQSELNDRQRTHATLTARMLSRFEWAEWLFHVDGDEVVHVDRGALGALPDDVLAVRLSPLEAVSAQKIDGDPTWFKPLLDEPQLVRLTELGVIGRPRNRELFRGHVSGKVGVRPAPGIWLAIHGAVDADGVTLEAVEDPSFTVLHYESPDGDEFVRKWLALLESGESVRQRPNRQTVGARAARILDRGLPRERVRAQLRRLYADHVADDVETLRDLGVLEQHDPDAWSHEPELLPVAAASAWRDAVEEMRGMPKSSLLPPARRGAPLEAPPRTGSERDADQT